MKIIEVLQKIGLKEPEAKVYLALLELNNSTVLPIAKKAGVTRTYCYDILRSLIDQGLASYYEKDKKRRYMAQDPERILRLLQGRLLSYEQVLPDLREIRKSHDIKTAVRFFEGTKGVQALYAEIYRCKGFDSIFSPRHLYKTFGEGYIDEISEQMVRKKMRLRELFSSTEPKPHYAKNYTDLQECRWLPEEVKLQTDIILYKNKLALISFEPDIHAIVVEGSRIVDSHRQLFEILWKIGR